MGRRDSKDLQWKDTKAIVSKRDKGCRLLRLLSPQEFLILKRNAGSRIGVLDHAHVLAVSNRLDLVYDPNNVVLLNRFSHMALDYMRSPITDEPITLEVRNQWWERIVGKKLYAQLITRGEEKYD